MSIQTPNIFAAPFLLAVFSVFNLIRKNVSYLDANIARTGDDIFPFAPGRQNSSRRLWASTTMMS